MSVDKSLSMNRIHSTWHRCGTVWFNNFFKQIEIVGIKPISYNQGGRSYSKIINKPLQSNSIAFNMCCDYDRFKIVAGNKYKAIHVYRDPRELIVSNYYSWKESHPNNQFLIERDRRIKVIKMNKDDGMIFVIDELHKYKNIWNAMRSWAESNDPNVKFFKLTELLKKDNLSEFICFMNFLECDYNQDSLAKVLKNLSFKKITNREIGVQQNNNHFRSGTDKTWRSELTDKVLEHFYNVTDNLTEILGYNR